jgi:Predicted oxidoreductases (related to aryl-alcohol dehydrogenases)
MQYRKLGKSGLKVSALSLGSWVTFGKQVDVGLAKDMIKTAFDLGINFLTMPRATKRVSLKS